MSSQPLVTGPFIKLVIGHALQGLGYASMLLLPLYLDHIGASRAQIGGAMASAGIGGLALRPAVGWALDTLGRRSTLMVGTLILSLSMAALALITEMGPAVYGVRAAVGVGIGTLFTGYFTFAADIIPEARRTEGIALFGISGLVPLAVNPFVGALALPPAALRWVFPTIAVAMLPSLWIIHTLPERPRGPEHAAMPLRRVIAAFTRRSVWPVWWMTVVFSGLVALLMAFATVTARDRGLPWPEIIWLAYAGGAVAVRIFGAKLPARLGPANLVAPALAAYALACLLVAGAEREGAFLLAGLLGGLGHGFCFPVLTAQAVSRHPAAMRGAAMAGFTGLWELSAMAMTPAFGALADAAGDGLMFTAGALWAAGGLALWIRLEHKADIGEGALEGR